MIVQLRNLRRLVSFLLSLSIVVVLVYSTQNVASQTNKQFGDPHCARPCHTSPILRFIFISFSYGLFLFPFLLSLLLFVSNNATTICLKKKNKEEEKSLKLCIRLVVLCLCAHFKMRYMSSCSKKDNQCQLKTKFKRNILLYDIHKKWACTMMFMYTIKCSAHTHTQMHVVDDFGAAGQYNCIYDDGHEDAAHRYHVYIVKISTHTYTVFM